MCVLCVCVFISLFMQFLPSEMFIMFLDLKRRTIYTYADIRVAEKISFEMQEKFLKQNKKTSAFRQLSCLHRGFVVVVFFPGNFFYYTNVKLWMHLANCCCFYKLIILYAKITHSFSNAMNYANWNHFQLLHIIPERWAPKKKTKTNSLRDAPEMYIILCLNFPFDCYDV